MEEIEIMIEAYNIYCEDCESFFNFDSIDELLFCPVCGKKGGKIIESRDLLYRARNEYAFM